MDSYQYECDEKGVHGCLLMFFVYSLFACKDYKKQIKTIPRLRQGIQPGYQRGGVQRKYLPFFCRDRILSWTVVFSYYCPGGKQDESPRCCWCCQGCCCSGSLTGSSWRCCSNCRRGSRGSSP